MHVDPLHTHAWVHLCEGRKRWLMLPPDTTAAALATVGVAEGRQLPSGQFFARHGDAEPTFKHPHFAVRLVVGDADVHAELGRARRCGRASPTRAAPSASKRAGASSRSRPATSRRTARRPRHRGAVSVPDRGPAATARPRAAERGTAPRARVRGRADVRRVGQVRNVLRRVQRHGLARGRHHGSGNARRAVQGADDGNNLFFALLVASSAAAAASADRVLPPVAVHSLLDVRVPVSCGRRD